MRNSTLEAFRAIAKFITSGKYTENQLIRAIAAFSRDKDNGNLDGWTLTGFVKNIDRFMKSADSRDTVHLICPRCKATATVEQSRLQDSALCHCGVKRQRADQAQAEKMAAWKQPAYKDLPTLSELEAAANRAMDRGQDVIARMALKAIEQGGFRQDKRTTAADYRTENKR